MSTNGFTARFKERYPRGAMGGIYAKLLGQGYKCRLKSTRTDSDGEKVLTVVCKKTRTRRRRRKR